MPKQTPAPKVYKDNPRLITDEEKQRLKNDLADLGDLGGIVHDLTTGNIVGGHQRLTVMFGIDAGKFSIDAADIEIVKQYKKPTKTGTVAEGFIIWNGERYAYRRVRYKAKQFQRANIVANLRGGTWDESILATAFDTADLLEYGFPDDFLLGLDEAKPKTRNDQNSDAVILDQAIQLKPTQEYIIVTCESADDWEQLKTYLELPFVRRGGYKPGSPFDSVGVQRVITSKILFDKIKAKNNANRRAK